MWWILAGQWDWWVTAQVLFCNNMLVFLGFFLVFVKEHARKTSSRQLWCLFEPSIRLWCDTCKRAKQGEIKPAGRTVRDSADAPLWHRCISQAKGCSCERAAVKNNNSPEPHRKGILLGCCAVQLHLQLDCFSLQTFKKKCFLTLKDVVQVHWACKK